MTVVVLGLVSVLLYGTSDFFGGLASRSQPPIRVTLVALISGAAVVLPALAIGSPVASWPAVTFGALAGGFGGIGVWGFYTALARGPIGFVAPVSALLCALVPSVWAFAAGEHIAPVGLLALVAVVVGGVLLSVEPSAGRRPACGTVVLTLVVGTVYGAYFIAMDATPPASGAIPMVVDNVVAVLVVGVIALVAARRRAVSAPRPSPRDWGTMLAAGATQGAASAVLVFALHLPGLAIVAALSALYPVTTVLLAIGVLRERVRPLQGIGILVAIAGVALLTLARS